MRRVALVTLIASTAAGSALAQNAPMAANGKWSVSAEVLFSWFKASPTPVPIITDNYIDAPGVNVLLGGGSVDTNPNAGFKLTGTYRVDSRMGIELTGFYIPSRSTSSSVSSTGLPGSIDLYLPYFDVLDNRENVTEISYWPQYRGSAQATLSNNLGGGEVNATWTMPPGDGWRTDLLAGFRYLQLRESYTINTSSPYNPPNPADVWNTTDSFDARNRFYGVQVGARAAYDRDAWFGGVAAKVALGTMQQRVSINGYLETNDYNNYGPVQTFKGGYFALPSNIGDYSQNKFTIVPEVAVSAGYKITPQIRVFATASFLYVSNVVRPGEQINRNINTTQSVSWGNDPPAVLKGPAQPNFQFATTDFWASTLSLGLAYSF